MLKHRYTIQDNLYEIGVTIKDKTYTYYLNSEYAYRKFREHLSGNRPGRALAVLNRFKIADMPKGEG